jgi:hypothetical protein
MFNGPPEGGLNQCPPPLIGRAKDNVKPFRSVLALTLSRFVLDHMRTRHDQAVVGQQKTRSTCTAIGS